MAPAKTGKAAAPTAKKEKIAHPQSRKAGQIARKSLRKGKMGNMVSTRHKKHNGMADVYGFFYHAMPEEGELTLEELHAIVRDVWLTRHDEELEEERAARRKGRPKSVKEVKLEDIKLREAEDYRTGFEVIDLTHPPTVELFRRWDQKEVAFTQLLRFIRINSVNPEVVVVSRPGNHISITIAETSKDAEMQGVEEQQGRSILTPASLHSPLLPLDLGEPLSRFSSTMMTMDGPLF